ncbi:MAG: PQQ-binding-like beta-propeller repeat protein [Verrucomicrobia bacterium]|nr:PQQ-binding-like beta-propeller repeat protein [Verrucomicrobiota bacterium]
MMFRTDPDLDTLLAQAKELAGSQQFRTAAELYQGLIEKGGDRVVAATATDAEAGATKNVFLPVAIAARDALLSGPAELRSEYVTRYEPQARRLADDALATHDIAALRRAAGRFPVTASAQRARGWSATLAADAGDFAAAASAWDEFFTLQPVLGDGGADVPLALAQHALALAKAGEAERAQAVAARLAKEFPAAARTVGGREQNVAGFVKQVLVSLAATTAKTSPLEPPAPTPRWTLRVPDGLSEFVATADDRVYFRSPTEITCVEVASGKRIWGAVAPMQLRPLSPGSRSTREGGERAGLDSPRFAVEAAGGAVYFIENFPTPSRLFEIGAMPGMPGRPGRATPAQRYATSSQLTARNAATGRRHWRGGGGEGGDDFVRSARWVTKPVVVGGRVLAIAVHIQSYYLVCLDAADGRLLWRSFISQRPEMGPGWPGQVDMDRPSPPCIAGGRVVCLTNAGAIGCFDAQTGEPLWFLQYLTRPATATVRGLTINGRTLSVGGGVVNPLLATRATVLAAPADLEDWMALDVASGRALWSVPRQGTQFLVGATSADAASADTLAVLAGPGAQAVRFADGQPAWTASLESASGRPVMHGTELYILQPGRGIAQLDARTGKRVAQIAVAAGDFRHLAAGSSSLVLLGEHAIAALRGFGETLDEIARRIEAEPQNPRWWRERGGLRLQAGEPRQALEDLQKARSLSPPKKPADAATTALLFRCHLALAEEEPEKALAWLEKAAGFAATTSARSERWLRLAAAHEARKAPVKACDALQMILDHESEAWIEQAQSNAPDGARVVGGRISNRALAFQQIERLVALYGAAVYARAETAAQRRLSDARTHGDMDALLDIAGQYPFGLAQEQARLLLARRHFDAREYDAAIEVLEQMLRGQPRLARAGDATLGLSLAGLRANRPGVTRSALAMLGKLPPPGKASFANTSGKGSDLARQLSHELPATAQTPVEPADRSGHNRKPVSAVAGGSLAIDGDRLLFNTAEQSIMRMAADGDRIVWVSAPGFIKGRAAGSMPQAATFGDTIVVSAGSQLAALDAGTGRLLWENTITVAAVLTPSVARFRQMALRGGVFIVGDVTERDSRGASFVIADGQLLLIERSRAVTSLSPRRAAPLWTAQLPGPEPLWAGAQTRTEGRWLAVMSADPAGPEGRTVAVMDVQRGMLLAAWELPQSCSDYTLRDDGRVAVNP